MQRTITSLVASLLLGSAVSAETADPFRLPPGATAEQTEAARRALYRVHMTCTAAANDHLLNPAEARVCAEAFLRLKLTFLPASDIERFETLSPSARAYANRAGYDAYRAWLHRHTAAAD